MLENLNNIETMDKKQKEALVLALAEKGGLIERLRRMLVCLQTLSRQF
jgi:hypothetical protein